MEHHKLPVVEFLSRLKKIDASGFTARDVMVLYTIIAKPGCSGINVTDAIGAGHRSNVTSNINRLARAGFIEDRRIVSRKANPSILHALPPGIKYWEDLKP